jgi:hypothetical protein
MSSKISIDWDLRTGSLPHLCPNLCRQKSNVFQPESGVRVAVGIDGIDFLEPGVGQNSGPNNRTGARIGKISAMYAISAFAPNRLPDPSKK